MEDVSGVPKPSSSDWEVSKKSNPVMQEDMWKILLTSKSVKEQLDMLKSLEFIMTRKPSVIEVIFLFNAALLYIFFHVHDPTTLNRQGNDVGTQYRSTVMYQT